jgi:prepilin-type N-terminal cleavage/methylation domain-containing protein
VLPLPGAEHNTTMSALTTTRAVTQPEEGMTNRKGFTLIELLIVVVIIGILAAIAIPKFASTKDKAKLASIKTDIRNYMTSEEAYFSDNNTYGADAALTAAPYNFTLSAGNTFKSSSGAAGTYSVEVQNTSISSGTNSCKVTVGGGGATDGVIQCP